MQALPGEARAAALGRVAAALEAQEAAILEANRLDLEHAPADLPAATRQRLGLKAGKLRQLATGIRAIAAMPDPIGNPLRKTEVAEGLVLQQVTAPIGVLLIIFEARPDALPQIAALALKSGNGLLLKGGKEAARSNRTLHRVFVEAMGPEVPAGLVQLVETRDEIGDLLRHDDLIDLVIPRGSNALVKHIQAHTKIPVMGHADGICHIFVDREVRGAAPIPPARPSSSWSARVPRRRPRHVVPLRHRAELELDPRDPLRHRVPGLCVTGAGQKAPPPGPLRAGLHRGARVVTIARPGPGS